MGGRQRARSWHSWPSSSPIPVLQIATGATAEYQGQFAYALSGIDPNEVYAVGRQN